MKTQSSPSARYARRPLWVTPEGTTTASEKPSHEIPTASLPTGQGYTAKTISGIFDYGATTTGTLTVNNGTAVVYTVSTSAC